MMGFTNQMRALSGAALLLTACLTIHVGYGQTIYVDIASGSDANNGQSWSFPKKTLQAGIDAAPSGGMVEVKPGVYDYIVTANKLLTVKAVSPSPFKTIIDGKNLKRCATLGLPRQAGQTNTVIIGFTLCNGKTINRDGQVESTYGGGVFSGTLMNCVIRNCEADFGGGVYNARLIQCIIRNNTASRMGGATLSSTLTQCTVVKNKSVTSGGILESTAQNSIVWENTLLNGTTPDNYGLSTFSHSCSWPKPSGVTNIDDDPGFIDLYTSNATEENLRLNAASPCFNRGNNNYIRGLLEKDIAQSNRIKGEFLTVDMGAFEGSMIEIFVDIENGKDDDEDYNGLSPEWPKKTIQAGVDCVDIGGVVRVAPSLLYTYPPVTTSNKDITIIANSDNPSDTIIDGGNTNRCVTITSSWGPHGHATILEGFTLRNGKTTLGDGLMRDGQGGGVVGGKIIRCIIKNCFADEGGGANGSILELCHLTENAAIWGGGAANSVILGCLINDNIAFDESGGAESSEVVQCTVVNNFAYFIGGGVSYGSYVANSIVWSNFSGTYIPVLNNHDEFSVSFDFSCTTPLPQDGDGNIEHDPMFLDQLTDNFQLMPNSPCIETGDLDILEYYRTKLQVTLDEDLLGNPRIVGKSVDMGAYTYFDLPLNVIYVSNIGDDANTGISWKKAKQTIQAGIDEVKEGGIVYVAPGTYQPIFTSNKLVRIEAVSTNRADTVIDGGHAQRCATLIDQWFDGAYWIYGQQTNSLLVGFTLQNGYVDYMDGQINSNNGGGGVLGGILQSCKIINCEAAKTGLGGGGGAGGGAFHTILYQCELVNNIAASFGGGAFSSWLTDCDIFFNSANSGGGVALSTLLKCHLYANNANGTMGGLNGQGEGGGAYKSNLRECEIEANTAYAGGGIAGYDTAINCLIVNNHAVWGGGASSATLFQCIVANNTAIRGGGVSGGKIYQSTITKNISLPASVIPGYGLRSGGIEGGEIVNSIVWGNIRIVDVGGVQTEEIANHNWGDYIFSCTEPLPPGVGNIDSNPHFINPAKDDYRLQSNSPCIDKGNDGIIYIVELMEDFDGLPRIQGTHVDIGACESPYTGIPYYQEIFVDEIGGDDSYSGASIISAKKTLQAAVETAPVNGIVYVAPGTYQPIATYNKPVRIEAISNDPTSTVIDGDNNQRCATLAVELFMELGIPILSQTNSTLVGLTLQNGKAVGFEPNSSALINGGGVIGGTLKNCRIINCETRGGGGGAYGSILEQCEILNNSAHYGGGVAYSTLSGCVLSSNNTSSVGLWYNWMLRNGGGAAYSILEDCVVSHNYAEHHGGGVSDYSTLLRCHLFENTANYFGGGAHDSDLQDCFIEANVVTGVDGYEYSNYHYGWDSLYGKYPWAGGGASRSSLIQCIVAKNMAPSGGGVYWSNVYQSTVTENIVFEEDMNGAIDAAWVENSIVWNNYRIVDVGGVQNVESANYGSPRIPFLYARFDYSCTSPMPQIGANNIDADPCFVNPANADYRLQSLSPCIDAGNNVITEVLGLGYDYEGNLRLQGLQVDMGAYERDPLEP